MTLNDPKSRTLTEHRPTSPGAGQDDASIPSAADAVGRYRYVVKCAPPETIEHATAEVLDLLTAADRERICYWLDQFRELGDPGCVEALPSRIAQAEGRRPRALERAVRAGVPVRAGEDLWLELATAFVSTQAVRTFFSELNARRAAPPMPAPPQTPTELESDPDFSEEFGFTSGYAGGSGFENVEFDRWI